MRVLLVPSKSNYPDPRPSNDIFGQGLPYLAASLKKAGHDVFGMNINYRWCHGSAQLFLESSLRRAIREYQPDLIGVGGLSSDYLFIRDLIGFVRRIAPDLKIVCGGGIVTYDRHYIFDELKPDYALSWDAEESFVKLMTCLERGGDLSQIENLSFFREGAPVYTAIHYSDYPLDVLPFPDYEPFDIEEYYELANQRDNSYYGHTRLQPRIMPLTLGRSCPFKCTFCCHQDGPVYRSRSIDNAVAEIVSMYNRYKFNLLFIYDELFGFRKNIILEFCNKVTDIKKRYSMDFDWSCVLRVTSVDCEILQRMKASGCIYVGYGLESASQNVLSSMKKEITVKQIQNAICMTEEAGLGMQGNFIFGDIAETTESIKETVSFFRRWCQHHMVNFGFVTPYPGSQIFDFCRQRGIIGDKREFYETIGGFGKACFNMTSIPDNILFLLVESLTDKINVSTVSPLCVNRVGIRNFDNGAPFTERRSTYLVRAECPHCGQEVEYLFPLSDTQAPTEEKIVTVCSFCHKKFQVLVAKELLSKDEEAPFVNDKKITISLLQAFIPQLVESCRGYNFVEYNETYYAVPRFLGSVDLKKKETRKHAAIVSATSWNDLYRKKKWKRFSFIYWAIAVTLTRIVKKSMSRLGISND
jgi:hypothetical protein